MASSWKRPLGAALLVEAIGLAGFFVAAVVSFSADKVIPALAFRWERAEALACFFRWLPALQFLGLAIALGSSDARDEELASRAIVPAMLLSALFSVLVLLALPPLTAARSSILVTSARFNSSLEAARSNLEAGDLALARSELQVCEGISSTDPRVEKVEEKLANAELKSRQAETPVPEPPAPRSVDAKTAKDYYLKALAFSEKGDHFSAHWYALTAERLDPAYADAKRLAAKSWEELLSRGASANGEAAAFYAKKLAGYGLLRSGDPVGAYGVFKELSERKDSDPDVARYLAESLAETEKAAFFKDEYDRSLRGGSIDSVFLRIPGSRAGLRLLAAASASFSGDAAYFRELEYLEAPQGGAPGTLVRAPYAKLARGQLFLLCVERESRGGAYRPTWSAGPASGPASVVAIDLSPDVAYRVLAARDRPASLPLVSAWRAAAEAPAYGVDPVPLELDLVARTGAPFALFASGLLGALAGARFKRRGGTFPRGLYALAPFMAAAGIPAFILAERVDALLAEWTARAMPGLGAVWVAALARTALLVLAVLLVAGTRTDRSRSEGQ